MYYSLTLVGCYSSSVSIFFSGRRAFHQKDMVSKRILSPISGLVILEKLFQLKENPLSTVALPLVHGIFYLIIPGWTLSWSIRNVFPQWFLDSVKRSICWVFASSSRREPLSWVSITWLVLEEFWHSFSPEARYKCPVGSSLVDNRSACLYLYDRRYPYSGFLLKVVFPLSFQVICWKFS